MLLETSFPAHTYTSCYARDIFSCTHTHVFFTLETSSLAQTHVLLARLQMFFVAHATCIHTSCVVIYISCTYIHTSCYAIDLLHCTSILFATLEISFLAHTHGGKKRRASKKLCPVKPNRMLQWVFKIPGIFKVQF